MLSLLHPCVLARVDRMDSLERMTDYRPTLAITMGDPAGIGPEVIVKALADPSCATAPATSSTG